MTWPFENDTSAIVKKLARKSVQADKRKNLFCIIAITVAVAMIMMALLTVQNVVHQNQSEVSGLHQGIFFDIPTSDKETISNADGVKKVGLSCNIKTVNDDNKKFTVLYYDSTMFELIENFEGQYPEKENEIAIADTFLKKQNLPVQLGTNILLNMDGREAEYTITGIFHDTDENAVNYPVFVSLAKCIELRGTDLLNAYVWLEDAENLTKDEAEELLAQIANETSVSSWTISGYYDYINDNISFSNFLVYGFIAGILFLAAALVIYSIFYISVVQKAAQYGQLRTVGASKKQIYKVVLKEGGSLALPGILFGCLVGTLISYILQPSGWTIQAFILSGLGAILFGFLLVYISVRKPAKIAAATSPIAALKSQAAGASYRQHERHRITPAYLAKINFLRNRKKSILTISSLGLCGIIFFLAASYQSSFSAESMARYWDFRYGDFKITVDLEDSTSDLDTVLRKEYFQDYRVQLENMDGVDNVYTYSALPIQFSTAGDVVSDNGILLGYNEKDVFDLNNAVLSGEITEETELIISDPDRVYDAYHWRPQVGESVSIQFEDYSGNLVSKEFTIGALTSSADGMGGYIFRMPEQTLKALAGYDCTYALEIQEYPEMYDFVESALEQMLIGNPDLYLYTIDDAIRSHQADNAAGFTLAYAVALILGVFAVINQLNLTITNLLSRKQEMGILKSIGMTNSQLKQSFMIEGLYTTTLAILITCIVGIPGGYIIGVFLKNAGMSSGFSFPTIAFVSFLVIMVAFESIVTLLLINSWKKQSIIEQMRTME